MYSAEYDGVLFVEGRPPGVTTLGPVDVRIHGIVSQAQLKSLDAVKAQMAAAVKAKGGNALIEFTYGQKSRFLASIFGLDDVSWYGSGIAAEISAEEKARLLKR